MAIAEIGQGDHGWARCIEGAQAARRMEAAPGPENAARSSDDAWRHREVSSGGRTWIAESAPVLETGSDAIDDPLGGGLVRHGVHEFIGDADASGDVPSDAPGSRLRDTWIPYLGPACILVNRLCVERHDRGQSPPRVAWVGHRCRPGPWRLAAAGMDRPDAIVGATFSSWFLSPPDTTAARRWCIEQAVDTDAVDLVVADGSGLPAIDSRRLQVGLARRRESGGTDILVLICRPAVDWALRSAATTRWNVSAVREGGWCLELRRCRPPQRVHSPSGSVVATLSP